VWLAGVLSTREVRIEAFEPAALATYEYDDLVVVCVVRLHVDEPASLLLH